MSGDLLGGKSNVTNTSGNSSPWSVQQPYLNQGFQGAQSIYNQGPYQGPFLGAQSPYTLQAQQQLANNPLAGQGQQVLGDTISGKYLDPSTNPFIQNAAQDALGQVNASFSKLYGGVTGNNLENSGYREGLARAMTQAALPIYQQQYQQERQNQLGAAQGAPGYAAASANNLFGAGASQEQRSQAEVQAQQQAFNAPWQNLQNYMQAINGNYGSVNNNQSPYYTNPLASLLGLGLGGTALYGMGQNAGLWGAGAGSAGLLGAGAGDLGGGAAGLALLA